MNCEDCAYWKKDYYGKNGDILGLCLRTPEADESFDWDSAAPSKSDAAKLLAFTADCSGGGSWFLTRPEFGCVQFAEK